jgi:hypothetical protein
MPGGIENEEAYYTLGMTVQTIPSAQDGVVREPLKR